MSDLSNLLPSTRELIAKTEGLVQQYPASEVTLIPADGDYDHRLADQGLIAAQICTRKTAAEAAEWLTTVRPPGTTYGRWEPDVDIDEVACADRPETHRHVIVVC